jgi:hypothetical protein
LNNAQFAKQVHPTVTMKADQLIKVLSTKAQNNEEFDLHYLLIKTFLDIIGVLAFNEDFDALNPESKHPCPPLISKFFQAWAFFLLTPPFVWKCMYPTYQRRCTNKLP